MTIRTALTGSTAHKIPLKIATFLLCGRSSPTDVGDKVYEIGNGPMDLQNILTSTKVGEPTLKGFPVLSPANSVSAAADAMRSHERGSTLVCSEGKLAGIFTERDFLRILERGGNLDAPLADEMTKDPQTVTVDDSLLDVVRLMDEGGYRRVPVVDSEGVPVSIVDVKTIVHFLVEHFPAAVYNQASHDQLIARNPEGA